MYKKDREILKEYIEKKIYNTESIKKIELLDFNTTNWWIFDFKSAFFNKETAKIIANLFWEKIQMVTPLDKKFYIGGLESGAIPLVSAIVLYAPENVYVQGFFVRKTRKKSDLANQIEGEISEDAYTVIVDDILNKGNSFEKIQKILEKEDKRISLYFSILRYRNEDFYINKKTLKSPILSLFELNDFSSTLNLKNLEDGLAKEERVTFEPVWEKKFAKNNPYNVLPKSSPVLYKEALFFGVDDGTFFSVNNKDGSVKWSEKILFGAYGKRIYSSPVVHNNLVMFGAYDGNFYALNVFTGKNEWAFFDADWIGSSPCVAENLNLVYVGLEFGLLHKKGGVVAIDIKTGERRWTYYEMDGLTHASPAYSKKHNVIVCGCNNKKIYCLSADKGELLWVFETEGEVKYGAVYDNKKNIVYVASMDGSVYGLNIKDGELLVKYSALSGFYSTPTLYKDILIIGSLDKNIYAWNTNTKNLIWKTETMGRIFASPVIENDKLYIGSNDGALRVIDPLNGIVLGKILLSERIVNKVTVDCDMVYVLTDTCELLAFKIKELQ